MRPLAIYVVYDMGRVVAVVTGAKAARALSPGRAYKSFKTQLEAEEYAAWLNYAQELRLAPRNKAPFTAAT